MRKKREIKTTRKRLTGGKSSHREAGSKLMPCVDKELGSKRERLRRVLPRHTNAQGRGQASEPGTPPFAIGSLYTEQPRAHGG